MTDIPKLEYVYKQRVDWEGTLAGLEVNEVRLCELSDAQYTMFRTAGKRLRETEGRRFKFHKLIGTAYTIKRVQ